ncbi:MAG: HDOD domain-containing protein [bacterium]
MPQTLAEVLRVSRDQNSSVNDLADVLLHDPAMTAKVLRMANSPYFGMPNKVGSMSQAVMTLGSKVITALALSSSVYDMTGKWASSVDRTRFWRHSLCVAISARRIAETVKIGYPEEAFIGGLLHDIGVLILESSFPDKYNKIWKEASMGEKLETLEENVWGTNHARVGQFLLQQWNLPEIISSAIGSHHGIYKSENKNKPGLSEIVALANLIAPFTLIPIKSNLPDNIEYTDSLCKSLELKEEAYLKIKETLPDLTIKEAEFLEINIGSPVEMLSEANYMLYSQFLTVEKLSRKNHSLKHEVAKAELEKAALKTLKAVTGTFNHYVNNAVGTIIGRTQLMKVDIENGRLIDQDDRAYESLDVVINAVNTIRTVMDELTNLVRFETKVYFDDAVIIDIEKKIKEQAEILEKVSTPTAS